MLNNSRVNADQFVAARVSADTKARLRALAGQQHLTESGLLKHFVELMLQAGGPPTALAAPKELERSPRANRLTIRLRRDDQILLRERAAARGMAPATYVSVLTRAHLRSMAPLPKEELLALKQLIAGIGAMGRNLKQIARAANRGDPVTGPSQQNLLAILRAYEAVRDHVRALLTANLRSWEQGYAEKP